jgi:hypothetical protein
MFGTAGYYYYYYYYYFNSVRIYVICLHFVPSCFFFDKKLCSICVILLHLSADLATDPMLQSLHISKLHWVELYHECNQKQIISRINFSSTIIILLMLPLDVISFYFFCVFSTVLMLFGILLLCCLCNCRYCRCASTLIIKSWVEMTGIIIIIIIIIFSFMQGIPRQTMSLGNMLLQLFCRCCLWCLYL